jgi:hypothetical protein
LDIPNAMKRAKIIKWVIYPLGMICLFVFISVRSLPLYNTMFIEKLVPGYWDKTRYGECYYFNHITDFREEGIPVAVTKFQYSPQQTPLEEAQVLIFGDSFLDISRGIQFPTLLCEKASLKKVHYVYQELPLTYLSRNRYAKGSRKILLLGLVERYIPYKFNSPHTSDYKLDSRSKARKIVGNIKDNIFYQRSEELYDALLKRSYATSWIYSRIATLKFDLFGYISKLTPKYLADREHPWLFYYDQVNDDNTSFYYHHTDSEMLNICRNIRDLADQLDDQYNIELVFLPIPAQYTLYHSVINNDPYNNFLPRLYHGLDEAGVPYVEIYDKFKESDDILYYGTDGHWNLKGLNLATEMVKNYLRDHYDLNSGITLAEIQSWPVKDDKIQY